MADDLETRLALLRQAFGGQLDNPAYLAAEATLRQAAAESVKKPTRKRGAKTYKAKLDGDGAIAQDDSFAVGAGAVGINGKNLGEVLVNSIKIVYGAGTHAPEDKRRMVAAYLNWLMLDCAKLKLDAIDKKSDQPSAKLIELSDIYIDLNVSLNIPVKAKSLGSYLAELKKNGRDRIGFDGVTVKGLRDLDEGKTRQVGLLEAAAHHRELIVLGKPGSGKSTFGAFVLLNLVQVNQTNKAITKQALEKLGPMAAHHTLLPVRIVLREFGEYLILHKLEGSADDVWAFFKHTLKQDALETGTGEVIERLIRQTGALFFFDGLDEASTPELRALVMKAVNAFKRTAGATCRYLVTARPYAWAGGPDPQQGIYAIDDLNPEQVDHFIERWYTALVQREIRKPSDADPKRAALTKAARRADIRPLAANPLLLTLMATLHTNTAQLPEDRASLYDEVVELLLDRWNALAGANQALLEQIQPYRPALTDVRRVIEALAFKMHSDHVGQEGTANIELERLCKAFAGLLGKSHDRATHVVNYIKDRAGLLLSLGERDETEYFTFPHRTFQEYLAACYLAGQSDSEIHKQLKQLTATTQLRNHWRQVLQLAARVAGPNRGTLMSNELIHGQAAEGYLKKHVLTQDDWERAILAGEMLREIKVKSLAGSESLLNMKAHIDTWLLAAMAADSQTHAPPRLRVTAGEVLSAIEDPRFDPNLFYLPFAEDGLAGFVHVPAGTFHMGTRKADFDGLKKRLGASEDEINDQPCTLREFYVARYPVTVAQYRAFAKATAGIEPDRLWQNDPANFPVRDITWHEMLAYCRWLHAELLESKHGHSVLRSLLKSGWQICLPSEAEWERAARGAEDRRTFPWGADPDPDRANVGSTDLNQPSPVGCFVGGNSPIGCYDMVGNVWEWTRSLWGEGGDLKFKYPYRADDGREDLTAGDNITRVLRGGAFHYADQDSRCAARDYGYPNDRDQSIGFRLVVSRLSS